MPTYEFLCEKCHKMFDVRPGHSRNTTNESKQSTSVQRAAAQGSQNSVNGSGKNIKKELKPRESPVGDMSP